MEAAARSLVPRGGRLPTVAGLPPAVVARLVHRLAVEASGEWAPLVVLDAASIAPEERGEALADAVALAGAGLLFLAGEWPTLPREGGPRVLREGGAPIVLDAASIVLLRRVDARHAVATDPALIGVRSRLARLVAVAGLVTVRGPAARGRAVVELLHAQIGGEARLVPAGEAAGHPSAWVMVEAPRRCPEEVLGALASRGRTATRVPDAGGAVRPDLPAFAPLIGASSVLAAVLGAAARYAPTELRVLILGESGTGKELLARALHDASRRAGGPYVAVDLGAIPRELVDAELFGYRRGAFTGAARDHDGLFARAHGGTLFLDELGNLDLSVQVKLLRAIQEGEIWPAGAPRPVSVDVRIVAATNADLRGAAARGEFRADLLYRFDATLELPPLRDRPGDIPALAAAFLAEAGARHGLSGELVLPPETLRCLEAWPWPGNVRELRSALSVAAVHAAGEPDRGGMRAQREATVPVLPRHLPGGVGAAGPAGPVFLLDDPADEAPWAAGPDAARRMAAVTVELPILPPSDPRARVNAALLALDGRAMAPDLLDALCTPGAPGEPGEVLAVLRLLLAAIPGRLTLSAARDLLPERFPGPGPMVLAATGAGVPAGPPVEPGAEIVVVGRVRSREELVAAVGGVGPGAGPLAEVLAGAPMAFLAFDTLPALSRVHLVVRRVAATSGARDAGLSLWVVSPRLPAVASVDGGPPAPIGVGSPVRAARGLRVELHLPGTTEPYLALTMAVNRGAWLELAPSGGPAPTAPAGAGEPGSGAGGRGDRPRATGALPKGEGEALHALLLRWPGENLLGWLREQLADGSTRAALGRYADRLAQARRPDQRLGAWYADHPELRAGLLAALAATPDPAASRARLPTPVRRALEPGG